MHGSWNLFHVSDETAPELEVGLLVLQGFLARKDAGPAGCWGREWELARGTRYGYQNKMPRYVTTSVEVSCHGTPHEEKILGAAH